MTHRMRIGAALLTAVFLLPVFALAQNENGNGGRGPACKGLPGYAKLKEALDAAVASETSGFNLHMWATVVDRDGIVCAIAFSGTDRGAQWPGSRVISAQKANTANSFSLDRSNASSGSGIGIGLALSTANLYSAVQPGGSLFGLQESNPVSTENAYKGPSENFGRQNDPLVGAKIGGVNVFGGGLALYSEGKKLVGAVGLSGDTSCADHMIAWRVRYNLELDHLLGVGGPAALFAGDPSHPDNIIFDIGPNTQGHPESTTGFGHPTCPFFANPLTLPAVRN